MHSLRGSLAALVIASVLPTRAIAQGRVVPPPTLATDTVVAAPGPRYAAGWLLRTTLGSNWRKLWQVPLTLPVLDIDTVAGGLKPVREGGGAQSVTLHLEGARDREWVFRSVDKYTGQKLAADGLLSWFAAQEVSALYPAGQLVVPPLADALGILHVKPTLYVMPADPALGRFQKTFQGMIGALEPIPNEGPDDSPGFAGSKMIVATLPMLDKLGKSPINRLDERELLRARLLDFLIGDTDRGIDQWRWARFPDPERPGGYRWRPIPRDRDWAFVSSDGLIAPVMAVFYPPLVRYHSTYASRAAYTSASNFLDRRTLTGIDRADLDAAVDRVQAALTDSVIGDAIARLPARYPTSHRRWMIGTMKARRDRLPGIAHAFYRWLAEAVDVRASDQPDLAEVVRRPNGTVELTLSLRPDAPDAGRVARPYYQRIFDPAETQEVRVYLLGGDDRAVIHGRTIRNQEDIAIRVIGGAGDDVLIDSTSGDDVHFYDAHGQNRFVTAAGTTVSTRSWYPPAYPEGVRLGSDWAPDFGSSLNWWPVVGYGDYAGIIVGAAATLDEYGFRRLPNHWQVSVAPTLALGALRPGLAAGVDWRPENSLDYVRFYARWSEYDDIGWYGLGNESPSFPRDIALVPLRRVTVDPDYVFRFGTWRLPTGPDSLVIEDANLARESLPGFQAALALGPTFAYVDPDPRTPANEVLPPGAPYNRGPHLGSAPVYQIGARATFDIVHVDRSDAPRRGYHFTAFAQGFPGIANDNRPSANLAGALRGYFPLVKPVILAARLGGAGAFGDFTAWDAAAIGGSATVRGYTFMRYTGDASLFANLELRAPVATVPFIVRGELGVLALGDAGRVWYRGKSPDGFHTSLGGGIWFAGQGYAVSLYLAYGDEARFYAAWGMPF